SFGRDPPGPSCPILLRLACVSDCIAAALLRRVSSTTLPRPFLVRKALTSASAAAGLSGCTGRAAYSGDTKLIEQPGVRMHGRPHSAPAGGVATPIRAAANRPRLYTPASLLALRATSHSRSSASRMVS